MAAVSEAATRLNSNAVLVNVLRSSWNANSASLSRSIALAPWFDPCTHPDASILPPDELVPVRLYSTALLLPALTQDPPVVVADALSCQFTVLLLVMGRNDSAVSTTMASSLSGDVFNLYVFLEIASI